jgi:galactokinase
MIEARAVAERFRHEFGGAPQLSWVPGRVNLIGDHVDYCGGSVLPMPIQFGTTIAARSTSTGRVRCISANRSDEPIEVRCDTERPKMPSAAWGRFVVGAVAELAEAGVALTGADVVLAGDIPGSGLSSSASLAVALLYALAGCADRTLEPIRLALAAQRIEHRYVGVQCGLMDQAAVVFAPANSALWFDCFDFHHRAVPIDDALEVVVVDTRRERRLVDSQYNARLRDTTRAAEQLGTERAQLARLGADEFAARVGAIGDPVVARRARHVVSESARVACAIDALRDRDWEHVGHLLNASHASLRDDFDVSCVELDTLAQLLRDEPHCYGARMTGAGFGGNVVALFAAGRGPAALTSIADRYAARFGEAPTGFVARSLGGVRRLDG